MAMMLLDKEREPVEIGWGPALNFRSPLASEVSFPASRPPAPRPGQPSASGTALPLPNRSRFTSSTSASPSATTNHT